MRRAIRDARAADPLISVAGLEQVLERRFNRGFSRTYVKKLAEKVLRQSLIEADRTKIEERLNVTREKFRLAGERLLKIIQWEPPEDDPKARAPYNDDVIEASKNLAMLDIALLKAEIECGMYRKPIELLAKEVHYEPLPFEIRSVIIAAWQRGAMLPRKTVEQIIPALVSQPKEIDNG